MSENEKRVLAYWDSIGAFERGNELSKGRPEFTFFDGPPFATGLPHYGHILAGTIKDVVTRFAYQSGFRVERRFGWDCHGLPVEFQIDTELGVKNRSDIVDKIGIATYNEKCRSIVMTYREEWRKTVLRSGRWIDFDNDYKTLDPTFMESVWWVFKRLFDLGLVYRAYKVMPYSTACATPLSNFEAGNNYQDVSDPSVVVSFPVKPSPQTTALFGKTPEPLELVAWTTTPWTLPSNMALCVHPKIEYSLVHVHATAAASPAAGRVLLLATARVEAILKDMKVLITPFSLAATDGGAPAGEAMEETESGRPLKGKNGDILATLLKVPQCDSSQSIGRYSVRGEELRGLRYDTLFDTFSSDAYWEPRAWRVLVDEYVTSETGTGVVHQAPAFGEDDYRVCMEQGVLERGGPLPCPVDENGCLCAPISDPKLVGVHVKEADKVLKQKLKEMNRLLVNDQIKHSYPFCWRSDTPLIYRAVPSWFIRVEAVKEQLVENNKRTNWVPKFVQEKRFHNWLMDARDWCVSRNRFWGTPLPLWVSEDFTQIKCVGSIAELESLAQRGADRSPLAKGEVTDIHRHFIDDLVIPDPRGAEFPPLRRVEEVFDCWFESGSMPYAQQHYPFAFQNKETGAIDEEAFLKRFPADFVAEGLDQTRGWFYTLTVIGTALFQTSPFKNLIVNGLILAGDGKKMSKKLKNYPPPEEIFAAHGADALRLFLVSSPAVRAEPVRFKEEGVKEIVKSVLLPWYHAFRFLTQEISRFEAFASCQFRPIDAKDLINTDSSSSRLNDMDRWILSSLNSLIRFVTEEMKSFRLYTACAKLLVFIDKLTNWYLRLNRDRMRGNSLSEDTRTSLSVLFKVLMDFSVCMASYTPFMAEFIYQHLRQAYGFSSFTAAAANAAAAGAGSADSVHFVMLPDVETSSIDEDLERAMTAVQDIIILGRVLREKQKILTKTPVKSLRVITPDDGIVARIQPLSSYIRDELNALELEIVYDPKCISLTALPNLRVLGAKHGKKVKELTPLIKALTTAELQRVERGESVILNGCELTAEELLITRTPQYNHDKGKTDKEIKPEGNEAKREEEASEAIECNANYLLVMDLGMTPELLSLALLRQIVTTVQKLRKQQNLRMDQTDTTVVSVTGKRTLEILDQNKQALEGMLRRPVVLNGALFQDQDFRACLDPDRSLLDFQPETGKRVDEGSARDAQGCEVSSRLLTGKLLGVTALSLNADSVAIHIFQ